MLRISIELAVATLDAQIAAECDRLSCAFIACQGEQSPASDSSPCAICGEARQYHRIIAN